MISMQTYYCKGDQFTEDDVGRPCVRNEWVKHLKKRGHL